MKKVRKSQFLRWLNFTIALFLSWQLFDSQDAIAQTINSDVTQIPLEHRLELVQDLENRELLTPTQAQQQRDYYSQIPDRSTPKLLQRVGGIFTLSNVIWIFSSILLVFSLGGLFSLYLWPLLRSIPALVYEIIAYLTGFGIVIGGYWLQAPLGEYIAFPGCLGFIGLWSLSNYLHRKTLQPLYKKLGTNGYSVGCLVMALLWSAIALLYESTAIGFITIIALEAYLGFFIAAQPGIYLLGFTSRSLLPRAVLSSLILLVFYITIRLTVIDLPYFSIFAPGVLFVGTFVYFLGLLIWSSKWYSREKSEYAILQPITILSGAIALYLGTVGHIPQLQGIGGTFFFLYVIEKYFELPWSQKTIVWATLGLSTLLFTSAWIMKQYPEYFLFI
ncbi:hypothetical protein PCC7418_2152 [Halothece sp. PCC 7418]|uniref:hypothetical protein n=1 Tax=Halothece sp. (strain PCC 7418) TaxID=65093 RepID=UPI0002A08570|nr:hypothetical protein [Halothece sp. PCC 7418]AFZ44312.1 hypothetical protein PCC7418_2152 [Halothece sp. PCC 7418]